MLVQSLLYFWIGVGLGYSLDRLSRALSPTAAERAEGRVDRGRLARDLCVLLPLYVASYLGVRTLTNWLYEILVWRPVLNRHAPNWFHHESYKLHMAYAMILGTVWTSPTTSAKTAALCGL